MQCLWRRFASLACLAALMIANAGALTHQLVTASELVQVLESESAKGVEGKAHRKSDSNLARDLGAMQLTQRVNEGELSRLDRAMPGSKSRRALRLLADQAAFLTPGEGWRIDAPIPEKAERQKMLTLTVDYVKRTISKLPNFYATRNTTWFADLPDMQASNSQPLHVVGSARETVLYRDGKEVLDTSALQEASSETGTRGVVTSGEYGPILVTAMTDLSHGTVFWNRWEKMDDFSDDAGKSAEGQQRRVAVFQFSVPRNKSHYGVIICCARDNREEKRLRQFPAYHGEIAIDPETGAIRRLMMRADLEPTDMVSRADTVVDFGPVDIGGATYICPLRSVTVSIEPLRERNLTQSVPLSRRGSSGGSADIADIMELPKSSRYLQTFVSDTAFDRYHVFRSEARMIIGDN